MDVVYYDEIAKITDEQWAYLLTLPRRGALRMTIDWKKFSQDLDSLAVDVTKEAYKAAMVHAPMHSHHEAHSVIAEEFDEYWELVMLNPAKGKMWLPSKGIWITPEERKELIRKELTQMGAMCLRALHDLC